MQRVTQDAPVPKATMYSAKKNRPGELQPPPPRNM